ncbi:kinase-like protein [Hyphopichia burtonii NRRL Y-1933]|uniref:non-specific serine/threonine protein kinase n=1 Tax=Hyphopichia burtonii NRRL Y-1933 TaxID=984485 RepID=A0A1E4RIZ7_9ASCO|nr:kinase-like protein [Hyphopichia burtonii NRRL Y-1933]ODV67201.1 kinase-like protein [Hyphopichia burtonii NRRL Y-1933]
MVVQSAEELEVCEEVGRGGFGVVYRGLIKANNEEVAIKQIDLENDQTDLFEVNKEILIISECRLPQITKYLGCFVRHFKLWVIMEYVNGGSLFELLKPGSISDENVILLIVKEILIALEYLHNQGKIHRDLKSQNILLNNRGEVKLTDFGVSTQLSSNFSRRNTTVGTPYWMAPEVILNNKGGHSYKADIWSLGCCAYELFNGKPPLQNQFAPMKALRQISRCLHDDDFTTLIGLDELDISEEFKDFLHKCFLVDPKERYSSTKLLKHKFITKYNTKPNDPLVRKPLKQLITRKQLWDQENHVLKTQKFYMATEMIANQKKWKNDGNSDRDKTIQFDISSINLESIQSPNEGSSASTASGGTENPGIKAFTSPISTSKSTRESSLSPNNKPHEPSNFNGLPGYKSNIKQDVFQRNIRQELNKILNKVFHRLELKSSLSTEQYDSLVSLNDRILNLATFVQTSDANYNNTKILICQYFKYFLKELTKSNSPQNTENHHDTEQVKASLQKMIIPSTFSITDNASGLYVQPANRQRSALSRSFTQFDEVENSLFASWIDKMAVNS